jgi:hypothetical protein
MRRVFLLYVFWRATRETVREPVVERRKGKCPDLPPYCVRHVMVGLRGLDPPYEYLVGLRGLDPPYEYLVGLRRLDPPYDMCRLA